MKVFFKAVDRKTGEKFWFDPLWGDTGIPGAGRICVVPWGKQLSGNFYRSNIVKIYPIDYDISVLNNNNLVIENEILKRALELACEEIHLLTDCRCCPCFTDIDSHCGTNCEKILAIYYKKQAEEDK